MRTGTSLVTLAGQWLSLFREGFVPSRPAAGAQKQVGTSLPSASICFLWAERLACADLESDFSQTFWPVDVSGGVIVSRWLRLGLDSLLILLWGKGGQLAQTPEILWIPGCCFFHVKCFLLIAHPLKPTLATAGYWKKKKQKNKKAPPRRVAITSVQSSVLNAGRWCGQSGCGIEVLESNSFQKKSDL